MTKGKPRAKRRKVKAGKVKLNIFSQPKGIMPGDEYQAMLKKQKKKNN